MSSSSSAETTKPAETAGAAAEAAEAKDEKIVLRSSDGVEFVVDVAVARMSKTISNMIDDDCVGGGVQLPVVGSGVLSTVLEYLAKKHGAAAEAFKEFEAEFFGRLVDDRAALFEVILAANFLDAQDLLGAAFQRTADRIKDMTVEEVREYFGVANDFTPAEEEAIRKENAWAFDA
ncbi:hypothetical protein ACP70R_040132 [Stipagrostis hirtigluma subsp. patula]